MGVIRLRRWRDLSPQTRIPQVLFLTIILFVILSTGLRLSTWADSTDKHPPLRVYDFVPGYQEQPHLTPIDVTATLIPQQQFLPIDQVHQNGLIHSGTWINVRDSEGKYLVLKRGPKLVTCPNSFSLLGEHAQGAEKPTEIARRAVMEELGYPMLKHIESIRELSTNPLFFHADYFNRLDRQITYIYLIEMDNRGVALPLSADNEVAEYRWVSDTTLQEWFKLANDEFRSTGAVGERMCHKAILTLWEKVHNETQKIIIQRTAYNDGHQKR
mmetsp:Transcript_18900/g.27972  ORF Transcript_18900/g.27972 Transcript_18900/m.27972 type:complete len:271 (+) Transcript_18900:343-1155(+)